MCPSLDSLRNTPEWVSRKDGAPSRLPNAQGELPGLAPSVRQRFGHSRTIQKGEIAK